jgi:NAD(P)-dependent dehydrogenase (short-subunit alcohol dehydrogenase family)
MSGLVEGKAIIVTGSGRGIGEGIARDLAAEGGRVAVADIDLAAAERVAAAIGKDGGEAIALQVNVVDRSSVKAMIQAAVRAFGRLDVMFNNAGISKAGQFLEATEGDWARIMGINGLGVLIGMQEAAKQMIAQGGGGKIINAASIAGKVGEQIATIIAQARLASFRLRRPERRRSANTTSRSTVSARALSKRRSGTVSTRICSRPAIATSRMPSIISPRPRRSWAAFRPPTIWSALPRFSLRPAPTTSPGRTSWSMAGCV